MWRNIGCQRGMSTATKAAGLYSKLLPASDWNRMPILLQKLHQLPTSDAAHTCFGSATCRRGSSLYANVVCSVSAMPAASTESIGVQVEIDQKLNGKEKWTRCFHIPNQAGTTRPFVTTQYSEPYPNSSPSSHHRLIEALDLLNLNIAHMEIVFDIKPIPASPDSAANITKKHIGFEHVQTGSRLRMFPSLSNGGFVVNLPSYFQPLVTAQTIVYPYDPTKKAEANYASTPSEGEYGWRFEVSLKRPDNILMRLLTGSQAELGGYSGDITRFSKPEVTDFQKSKGVATQPPPSSNAVPKRQFSTFARGNMRRFSTTSAASSSTSSSSPSSIASPTAAVASSSSSSEPFRVLILGGYGLFGLRVAGGLLLPPPGTNPAFHVYLNARNQHQKEHDQLVARLKMKRMEHPLYAPADATQLSDSSITRQLSSCIEPALFNAHNATELDAALARLQPHVVINCAGPFQTSNYQIAQNCAKARVHYIDLADARMFVAGFQEANDELAKSKQVSLISGASSVPALSSAAVQLLLERSGLNRPELQASVEKIEIGISPGNHTPRGLATMQSILQQVGRNASVFRQGAWQRVRVWSWGETKRAAAGQFSPKLVSPRRWLSLIDVPDLELFPNAFKSPVYDAAGIPVPGHYSFPTVEFRAGLEFSPMHWALVAFSTLVSNGLVTDLVGRAPSLKKIAESKWFMKPGSDTGGMFVQVEGRRLNPETKRFQKVKLIWRLCAKSGEGLQIPATASVCLTHKLYEQFLQQKQRAASINPKLGVSAAPAIEPIVPVGAHAALNLFTVDEFMHQLQVYDISADIVEEIVDV